MSSSCRTSAKARSSSEIVAWHVKVGDQVAEDQPMVEMSTDKAVVEMPSPVTRPRRIAGR